MKRIILIFVSVFSIVFASQAATFTVTSGADNGIGTLRQALQDAAASNVTLPHTITFSSAMTVTIDGDLQINAGNHNGITINGFVDGTDGPDVIIRSRIGTLNHQLILTGTVGAKIYGLVFQNLDYGIHLNGATTTEIKGCYFGTNAAGTAIVNGINQAGVFIEQGGLTNANALIANNIIGGLTSTLPNGTNVSSNNSERCIFAGCAQRTNAGNGVRVPALLVRDVGGTRVVNNYFGVDATGTVKLGNGNQTTKMPLAHSNIYMNNAKNVLIDRNVISGATGSGIHLENWCNNAKIKGNKIGTNALGTAAYNTTNSLSFSNEATGIFIQSGSDLVIGYDGGTLANERNIISGNGGAKHNNWQQTCDGGFSDYNQFGIYAESIENSIIKGNYIGTDATGNSSGTGNVFGNRAGGFKLVSVNGVGNGRSQNNTIGGGTTANDRNIISGNGFLWKANDNTSTCGAAAPSGMVSGPGLLLQYANTSSNTVSGNYIGLGADGLAQVGNNANGIEIQGAASNNIGTAGVPNYICNNTWGIFLQVDFGSPYVPAANNNIVGNIVGLTPTNTVQGNGVRAGLTEGGGIGLQMGVTGNKIGTAVADGGNVVSGNQLGISIQTNSTTAGATAPSGNIIYNNIIGLDPTGSIAKPNTSYGISISMGGQGTVFPFNNTIGGTGANQANTISSNQQSGIYISHTAAITPGTANNIVGNKIGTNSVGTGTFGNTSQGIEIVNVSRTTITSNTISNNSQNGISLTGSTTNTISGNTVNTNGSNGISLSGSSSNTIQSNTINSNVSNGISLVSASASNIIGTNTINTNGVNGIVVNGGTSVNNAIHRNSFSCNIGRGIVLAAGGNASYAAPTIVGTQTQITWTGGTYIEVYETDGCATCPIDPTRLQGRTYINGGNSPYVFDVAAGFDKTKTYTAIAHQSSSTSTAHNTSEFSQCYTLCQNPTSVTITGTPLTFCAGGSVTLTANIVGGSGTETYVWRRDNVVVTGSTNTLVASVGGSYTVEYSSTNTCSGTQSTGVTVTVNERPTVTSSATGTVCSNVAQNYTITASVNSTFAWTRAIVTGISNPAGSGATNTITETLINTTTSAVNVVYSITPTSVTGSCAATAPFTYTVTVNPAATVTNQAPAAICSGTAFTVTPTGVPAAGTTYTWGTPNVTVGSVSGATPQATAQTSISQTLTNNGITAATVVYTVTPKSGTCDGATFTVTVTINPKANVTAQAPAAICSGTAFSVTPTGVPAGTTYTWGAPNVTVGSVSGATAQATAQTSIGQTLTNNGTTVATVVYTVTPKSGTCDGATFTVTVTVNPDADVADQTPAAICSGSAFSVTPANVPAGTTYTWGVPNVTVGSVSGATAEATAQTSIGQTLDNNGTADATVVYTVTPKSGTCDGATFTVTVTVKHKPEVASNPTGSVCSGVAQNYTIAGNVPSSFTWTRAQVAGIDNTAGSGSSNPITEALINATNAAVSVEYIITPTSTAGSCVGTDFTYTVTVDPKPEATITPSGPTAFCPNQSVDLAASASGFTGGTVEWFDENGSLGNANPLTVSTAGTYTVVYTTTSSCASLPSKSVTITMNPDIDAPLVGGGYITCLGNTRLVGNIPLNGIGTWTVELPSTAVVSTTTDGVAEASNLIDGEIYTFTYTISANSTSCGSNKQAQIIVEAGLPGFDVTASGPTDTLCVTTGRTLTASVTLGKGSGNFSYVWVSSDGSLASTVSSPNVIVKPNAGGETTYTVYVIDNDNPGCKTGLATVSINAVESQDLKIPNLITPNGDNLNDIFILRDKVTQQDVIKEGTHIEVVNRWGSRVYEAKNYENNWIPKELTDGMYYYRVSTTCGNKEYKSWLQILGNTNN